MKKLFYLIVLALILGLILTGCFLSNVGQIPTSEQSGITYLTKSPGPVLAARWNFNEGTGTTAFDSSVYGNDGTITGATYTSSVNVIFGDALSFDGNDYVEVPDNISLDITGNITVEGWIYLTSLSQPATVAGKWKDIDGINQRGYLLTVATDGTPRFYVSTNGFNYPRATGSALSLNTWYHLAGTYDGENINLYVGTTPSSTAYTESIFLNDQPLLIGANDGFGGSSRKFTNGIVDEVRVWSSVLDAYQLDDMTPPTINSSNEGEIYSLNEVVAANGAATDSGTGVASVTTSVVNLDTSTVGAHTFTVTATDYAKNEVTVDVNYNVEYVFYGLLAPYAPPEEKVFKLGRTIPLKWQYTDFDGIVVDSAGANPTVEWVYTGSGNGSGDLEEEDAPGASGLRYDDLTMTWQFNWQTKGREVGLYEITITSDQAESSIAFPIELRK